MLGQKFKTGQTKGHVAATKIAYACCTLCGVTYKQGMCVKEGQGKYCGELPQECVVMTRDTCMYAVQIVEPHGTCHGNKPSHRLNVTFSLRPDPSCLHILKHYEILNK